MPRQQNADTISERRLRPIYDWLDNGNNKKALQEADKVLRKQPDFQCCRALKSLALMRLGKEDEALVIMDKILSESPVDEGALQAMTIGYREMKMPEKICTMYENATKKEPGNEEFLSHLFMAYVRLGQLKKQQATAMNLYKAKNKNPYYFWSVMSLVLQAMEGDEKIAQTVSLPLANKMVEKMEKEGRMEQEQETMIYLMILQLRKNWKGALDVLNGPLGKKLENSASYHLHCVRKRIELEEKMENWPEVARLSRNILLSQPDSWDTVNSYIGAVMKIQANENGVVHEEVPYDLKPNRIDRSVEEAESLLNCLRSSFPGLRCPYLGKVEICHRLKEPDRTKMQDLLVEYIDRFGSKPVCFSDIKKYLSTIPKEDQDNFIIKLKEKFPEKVPTNLEEIHREICLSCVERFLGRHLNISNDVFESMIDGLLHRYIATQPLVSHLESKEFRPSDGYLVISSHLLWEKWMSTKNNRYFLLACSLLRLGLQYSPSNWQLRLLLARFCGRAGAGGLCEEVIEPLDVKHLMLDTLGWMLPRILSSTGQIEKLDKLYCQMIRFYTHSPKESTEYIIQAYKYGNFPQICDIQNLKRRISSSYTNYLVNTESLLLSLLYRNNMHDQVSKTASYPEYTQPLEVDWDSVRDNRDFRTMVCYEPDEFSPTEEFVNFSFKAECQYARVRGLILRGLVVSLGLSDDSRDVSNNNNNLPEGKGNIPLKGLIDELSAQLENSKSLLSSEKFLSTPQAPHRCRLSSYLPSQQVELVLSLLSVLQSVLQQSQSENSDESISSPQFDAALQRLSNLQNLVTDQPATDWSERWSEMEETQYLIETLCISTVLAGCLHSLFKSHKGGKKGKKATVSARYNAMLPKFSLLLENLEKLGAKLEENHLNKYKRYVSEMECESLIEYFSSLKVNLPELLTQEKLDLVNKFISDYESQQTQMSGILAEKLKYLESLKI